MLSIYEQARKEFEKYYDYQMSVEVSAEIKKVQSLGKKNKLF